MSIEDYITAALIFGFVLIAVGYLLFQQGRESGCETHEYMITQVKCIKCKRKETRFEEKVIQTRDKNISTPTSAKPN